jgi:hypothetical protein
MRSSTLVTSPKSAADFLVRVAFFAAAPVAIVFAAAIFPVTGALVNVGAALLVFLLAEAVHATAARRPWIRKLLSRELALEEFYRRRPPRPFLYYVFYPLLFPYWLLVADARREFWLFKGYTVTSLLFLLGSAVVQFVVYWQPELGVRDFLPIFGITLGVETVLVLMLLMPIATTVIGYHQSFRRGRLVALLAVALVSTTGAIVRLSHRRDPIVSFATRARVRLRTAHSPRRAREAQLAALHAAWSHTSDVRSAVEGDGKIEGDPLDRAHEALGAFYKKDEAYAFDLWASPRHNPKLLVLYFEARRGHDPIWIALKRGGEEIRDPRQLPKGAFLAMREAAAN